MSVNKRQETSRNVKMPTEHAEQRAVVSWLRRRHIRFFAVPNGAQVSAKERAKLKAEGLEPGVPDLMFPGPRLALEMKARSSGATSDAQDDWLAYLAGEGWDCAVCHGAAEAIAWLKSRGLG